MEHGHKPQNQTAATFRLMKEITRRVFTYTVSVNLLTLQPIIDALFRTIIINVGCPLWCGTSQTSSRPKSSIPKRLRVRDNIKKVSLITSRLEKLTLPAWENSASRNNDPYSKSLWLQKKLDLPVIRRNRI